MTASYELDNAKVEIGMPVEVGSGAGHFWFPSLPRAGDLLVCAVVRTADIAQGQWPAKLYVNGDNGATWEVDQRIDSYGHASVRQDEHSTLMMPYETWPAAANDRAQRMCVGHLVDLRRAGPAHRSA